jgi:hypothetical protein
MKISLHRRPSLEISKIFLENCFNFLFFSNIDWKMILSSLYLVRKVGVCITSEENGETKLTSEENLFNTLLH